jgi:hypothetical protein
MLEAIVDPGCGYALAPLAKLSHMGIPMDSKYSRIIYNCSVRKRRAQGLSMWNHSCSSRSLKKKMTI